MSDKNPETLPLSELAPSADSWLLFVGLMAVVFASSARTAGLVLIGYWVLLRAVKILVRDSA